MRQNCLISLSQSSSLIARSTISDTQILKAVERMNRDLALQWNTLQDKEFSVRLVKAVTHQHNVPKSG